MDKSQDASAYCLSLPREARSAPMKCLLSGLASLLLLASPSLAVEEAVEEGKGTTWNSGWGMMESGARLAWRVADVTTGQITLSFLIAVDDNVVSNNGFRYWSTGEGKSTVDKLLLCISMSVTRKRERV